MSNFNKLVANILSEMSNTAGTAFGPAASGEYGNQFPSQNDNAYAPGDSRIPSILGAKSGKRKRKGANKSKGSKVFVQRRNLSTSL